MGLVKIGRVVLVMVLVISNISCDQISKKVVRSKIEAREVINVVDDHFILTKVENGGAALSMGEHLPPTVKIIVLQVLPLIVLIFLLGLTIFKAKLSRLTIIGMAFIIGGGIGNIYDRILYGSVTDFMFIKFEFFQTGIFNMADVSVVIGLLFVVISYFSGGFGKNHLKPVT